MTLKDPDCLFLPPDTARIVTLLVKKLTCWRISQGTITISHNNTPAGVLDYGTGQCDRKATLTVNGVLLEISLV